MRRHPWLTFESSKPLHWNRVNCETDPEEAGYQLGKPALELDLTACTDLSNLLGPQSFLLFYLLGLSWKWLREAPDKGEQSESYKLMRDYVRTFKVTKDVAERGVKLLTD